jgi:hypothetical protein
MVRSQFNTVVVEISHSASFWDFYLTFTEVAF